MLEDSAVKGDDRGVIRALRKGAQINQRGEGGWPAIACAANYNRPKTLKLLLEYGADINLSTEDKKETALIIAARTFNIECVRILLAHKADVNAKDREGETAFLKIAFSNEEDIARLLLENGADIDAMDRYGETALSGPLKHERFERVRFLLEHGADLGMAIGKWGLEDYANKNMAKYVEECKVKIEAMKGIAASAKKDELEDIIESLNSDLRK